MKRTTALIGCIIGYSLFCQAMFAGAETISPKALAGILKDENVVIVSARKPGDYKTVHINGAVNVWHMDLYKEGDIKGMLKSPEEIAKILGSKGISQDNTIVIYDGGQNTFAGRLYWIFDYLGCEDVKILDGQMKNWRKTRKPVTKNATTVSPATFTASPDEGEIAIMKYIKEHLNDANVVIVDVRSKDEYDGKKGDTERKGHIPGAIFFEYKNIINEDDTIKSKEELAKLAKAAGITSDKEVMLYCLTSVRAGIVYMAFKSILGFPNVKVYDGAFNEWSADSSNPVE